MGLAQVGGVDRAEARVVPARVRALVEFLAAKFAALPPATGPKIAG
ncbi:hypothetical protein [Variovorax sp. RA8]|jgi:hypothetical protein|nr:hypothetical protein [Variovorax sp. RA8]VTU36174.1 hypothetical protein RA8CHR_05409 [Variovorax sp. RA8]